MSSEHVQGTVADGFEPVREEFAAVAAEEGGDYAAQLVAHVDGERVVDLWTGPAITGDSLTGVFSSTKGAAHLVVALLVQDGVLDLDQRVAHYRPEFGAARKDGITLRDLLAHRAGVVGADEGFGAEEIADDRVIAERLAPQRPYWRPGTAFGYHALVIGALTGEVVRRVTGRSIQEHYEERVRQPFGLDFHLGQPVELEPRFLTTQPMLQTPEQQAELEANATGPNSITGIAFNADHPNALELWELPNIKLVRQLSPASVGGVASARGLTGMYAAAISGPEPLLRTETAAEFARIHSIGDDLATRDHNAFGLGLAYGYNRRRFAFPGGAAPENARWSERSTQQRRPGECLANITGDCRDARPATAPGTPSRTACSPTPTPTPTRPARSTGTAGRVPAAGVHTGHSGPDRRPGCHVPYPGRHVPPSGLRGAKCTSVVDVVTDFTR
ncbi:beta-lactamase family protein [Amycolatopsis sp. H6(2020)]|nr:beta-lactamase family protein [Amycolatopsis sp. H6(2020)]